MREPQQGLGPPAEASDDAPEPRQASSPPLSSDPSGSSIVSRAGDRVAWFASAVGLERWARIVAAALPPLLLSRSLIPEHGLTIAALLVYVLLTAIARRDRFLRAADLIVAAAVIVASGPDVTAFLPFLLVATAGPATQGGIRAGVAAGGTLAAVVLVRLALDPQVGSIRMEALIPLVLLLPLGGVTTATASQLLENRQVRGRLVLQQAHRLLSSLNEIADEIPGGLDISTVCGAILAELRSIRAVAGVVVFAEDAGLLRPLATSGVAHDPVPTVRLDELRRLAASPGQLRVPHQLPVQLRQVCATQQYWVVQPLGEITSLRGVVLIGFDDLEVARQARSRIASIAADGAVALENARLFDGTRARAADAARRQVAADLHDGVAQSLTHLRMELELMALDSDGEHRAEVVRLSRVAAGALTDLRATIGGLRRSTSGDLAERLKAHLGDLHTPHGPTLELESSGDAELNPQRTEEVLRIAQEAVSNALRHADAHTITVTLDCDATTVLLLVEDDGGGVAETSPNPGDGIGLKSMRERAARLSGDLEIRERVGGGTLLALRFPIRPSDSAGRTS